MTVHLCSKEDHGAANKDETGVDFSKPWEGSDIIFLVEDKKIYANKLILSMATPVFKLMFEADFKEKDAEQIPLPDKTFEGFLALMQFIHPPGKFNCKSMVLFHHFE